LLGRELDGEREGGGPLGNLLLESLNLRDTRGDLGLEVLELVGLLGKLTLDLQAQVDTGVDVAGHTAEVVFAEATGSSGGGTDTDTAGGERALVAGNGVLVAGNVGSLKDSLNTGTVETLVTEVEEDHVRVGTVRDELVAQLLEFNLQSLSVGNDLLLVLLELGGHSLLERHREGGDGVVVGSTLVTGEDTEFASQRTFQS
jgi:hypothetical protein